MVFRMHTVLKVCWTYVSLSRSRARVCVCIAHTNERICGSTKIIFCRVSTDRSLCVPATKQYNRTAFTEESSHRIISVCVCVSVCSCVKHRNKNRDKFNWEMSTTMTLTTDTNTHSWRLCWIKITAAAPMTKPTSIWYGLRDKLFTTIIYNAHHLNFSFTHDNYRFYIE